MYSSVARGETQLTSIDDQKRPEKGLQRLTRRGSNIRDNMTLNKRTTE